MNNQNIKTLLIDTMESLKERINRYLSPFRATGDTERATEVKIETRSENSISGQLLVASPMLPRLDGRKKGKVPHNFTDIILRWMSAKGIGNDRKMAAAIAWNIHWHGTKQRNPRSTGFEKELDEWEKKELSEFCRNVASSYSVMIKSPSII